MVITIEPGMDLSPIVFLAANSVPTGIYVPPLNTFPHRFHNMGIRIEASWRSEVPDLINVT